MEDAIEPVGETLTTAELAGAGDGLAATAEPRSFAAPAAPAAPAAGDLAAGQAAPLFSPEEARDFQARWDAIQVSFVDEPRHAVEQADGLVAATMKRQAEIFAESRAGLEGQWDRGDAVSTEDLRLALRRYRSFFSRLLNI